MTKFDGTQVVRALVVDDEESILTFAERTLRDAGYEVVIASDGPEALRIVEAQSPFDLFVVGILMPEMRAGAGARGPLPAWQENDTCGRCTGGQTSK